MNQLPRYYPKKYPQKVGFQAALTILQTENEQFMHTNFECYFNQLQGIENRRSYFPSHVPSHLLPYSSPLHLFGAAFYLANGRQAWNRSLETFRARYGQEIRQINGGKTFLVNINSFIIVYSLHPLPISAYQLYFFTYGAIGKKTAIYMRKMCPNWFRMRAPHNCYSLTDLSLHYLSLFWAILHEYQRKVV
jgi:hypothetical protein